MELMDSEEDVPKEHHEHKRGKYGKKNLNSLPPRKAIKKLIFRELENQAHLIFEQLMKCKEIG